MNLNELLTMRFNELMTPNICVGALIVICAVVVFLVGRLFGVNAERRWNVGPEVAVALVGCVPAEDVRAVSCVRCGGQLMNRDTLEGPVYDVRPVCVNCGWFQHEPLW